MSENKKINLPKTAFSMKANLNQKEPVQQAAWEEQNIYQKMLDKNTGNTTYTLHDGPPYANGHIHLGHALNKVLKDIVIKYESMQGKYTPYIPGWDCHGLPIEFQLLKQLNTDKNKIAQLDFRKKAAAFAKKYIAIQKEEFKRLGIFGDWENPYLTIDSEYESTIIRIFKELVKKQYIYRGVKPVYWCATCETALAEAEVEYNDHSSPAVFVKFPISKNIVDLPQLSIVIWTTTPWTLPANVAVAFHPEHEYAAIRVLETSNRNLVVNEHLFIAKELISSVCEKLNITQHEVIKVVQGSELKGIECMSPFRKKHSVGVVADFVTLEDGTGIVHIAPGHGEDDYLVGIKYKLPIITPVDDQGRFTDDFPMLKGTHVFEANTPIIENLDQKRLLLFTEKIEHSYPHCWRCKKPIVFRATSQWFLSVEQNDLRKRLLKTCETVSWIPKYGLSRISAMIQERPDWCLSRQRLWGVPIPAFYCENCEELLLTEESMTIVENLFAQEGSDAWFVKKAEEILPDSTKCKCGSQKFHKETDILDVWFDSGVSHEAVLKNKKMPWPADLYLEGSDQHRGWFQTSLIPSVALHDAAPYKTVLTHGFTVDGEGKKMSKSVGNVIAPQEIIKKYGADILRLWIASENYKEDMRISDDIIKQLVDAYRKIRNTARYMLGNISDYNHKNDEVTYESLLPIDKWALGKLSEITHAITTAYEKREFHLVYRLFYNFSTVELSSLYFDILKDRLYVSHPKSQERRSAQTVLYYLVTYLSRIIAPIIPFTAEEIREHIPGFSELKKSILLDEFPSHEKKSLDTWNDPELMTQWDEIFTFRSIILKKIEEQRLKKILGNSLEARVTITLDKDALLLGLIPGNERFWEMIAIVSQAEIIIGKVNDENAIPSQELPPSLYETNTNIKVTKAAGAKCSRCWNWNEKIGNSKEFPDMCPKCADVLKEW